MRYPNFHTLYLLLVQPDLSFPRLFIWCLWWTTLSGNASAGFKIEKNVLSLYSVRHCTISWNVNSCDWSQHYWLPLLPPFYPIGRIFLLFLPKHPGSPGCYKILSPTLNKQFLIQLISLDLSFVFLLSTISKNKILRALLLYYHNSVNSQPPKIMLQKQAVSKRMA